MLDWKFQRSGRKLIGKDSNFLCDIFKENLFMQRTQHFIWQAPAFLSPRYDVWEVFWWRPAKIWPLDAFCRLATSRSGEADCMAEKVPESTHESDEHWRERKQCNA
jgi:hypothetical protein